MWKQFFILAAISVSFVTNTAWANETLTRDFAQPINIDADHEFFDLRNNIVRVEGHVVITQGSLIIHAESLVIEGFGSDVSDAERLVATGSPATYQQEVDVGVTVNASANIITYDAFNRILILSGNAELLQSGNFLKASDITYDLENQTITAERGEQSGQRVRTSLQPREQSEEKKGNN